MPLTSYWLVDLLVIFITILFLIYKYYTRHFDVFKKRDVKHLKPLPFFGNFADVLFFKKHAGELLTELYRTFGDVPYFGVFIFDVPYLVIKSPEIVKNILVKDFSHFMDRTMAVSNHDEIVRNALFFQRGEEWKATRSKLTPVFTSGRLKAMLPIMITNGAKLTKYIRARTGPIDLENMTSRYVADNICRVFFGMDVHGLEDENSEFIQILTRAQKSSFKMALSFLCYQFQHQFVNPLRLKFGDRRMVDFSIQAIKDAFEAREKSSVRMNDLVDIIRDLRQNEEFSNYWDFKGMKVLAQPFQFFIAGHVTSTHALSYTLYHLAMNPDIQDTLRKVIQDMVEEHGGITYEALIDKKYFYLDMVLNETFRMNPALPYIDRTCTSDYKIPGTDYVVRKGERVIVPTLAYSYDKKYYPNPEKYNPDRFLDKQNEGGLYFIPFGEGPRACIGERLALLNLKVGLSNIMLNFSVERIPETPEKFTYDKKKFGVAAAETIYVSFKPLS